MELTQLDINLLRNLDVLLQEKSVTRAARRLFVTQPAASGSLQRLREIFQDPLLIRVGRGMELTPLGRLLAEPVRDAMMRIQKILEVRTHFDPATSEKIFRLAMSDYCTNTILPPLIRRVVREAPGVKIVVSQWLYSDFDLLQAGDVDLQIVLDDRRVFADDERFLGLNRLPLISDRFVCVVAADHPVGSRMTVEEYVKFRHAGPGHHSQTALTIAHAAANVPVLDAVMIGNFTSLLFQLPRTQLIAIVPRKLATLFTASLELRILEPPIPIDPFIESAFWHSRNDTDPGHIWLRKLLEEVCHADRLDMRPPHPLTVSTDEQT